MSRPEALTPIPTPTPVTRPTRGNARLRIALIKRGLRQRQIAEYLQITTFRMSRIVCGAADPTPDEQDKIAEVLGMSRRALFGGQ